MSMKKNSFKDDYIQNEDTKNQNNPLTAFQEKSINRFCKTIQLEQEAYLQQHPEVKAMLELFINKAVHDGVRKNSVETAAKFFTRPTEELDQEIRNYLHLPNDGTKFCYMDEKFEQDIKTIQLKLNPPSPITLPTESPSTVTTLSSSFLSLNTSDTTLPTPEPIPTPELTTSQIFYNIVSNTVDKAIYLHVDEPKLLYDTAYVEILKAVENAMEIAVSDIKEEIIDAIFTACSYCENIIKEKEIIAAKMAWEKRMRKKMKRTIRRINNFKGFGPTNYLSETDSDSEKVKIPPHKPCKCHPQFHYNRYPKDRFGIYLPGPTQPKNLNITTTPVFSVDNILDNEKDRFGIYLPGPTQPKNLNITTTPVFSVDNILDNEKA